MSRIFAASLLALITACGHESAALDLAGPQFPADKELERLAARPVQPPAHPPSGPSLPRWELEQPLPDHVGAGPALGDSLGEQLLVELTAADAELEADEAMTCAAHQLGRFVAQNGVAPTRALLRFIVHRCGVTMTSYGWAATALPNPPELADARALLDQYANLRGKFGLWVVPHDDRWVMLAVAGKPRLEIDPVAMAVEGDQRIISGRLHEPRDWVMGHVSHGEHGVGDCQSLAETGDAFRLVCPVLPTDAGAYVDIYTAVPGRVLGDLEARLWLSPDGSLSASYHDPSYGKQGAPLSGPLDAAFVSAINDVRVELGARPLVIADEQSAVAQSLRPHFRAARASGDGATLDQIVLGLLAGWKVQAPILDGNFSELEFENVSDRHRLLASVLDQPGLRAALLDPRASRIALAVDPGQPHELLGGMFATYILADPGPRVADREWIIKLFELARKSRNLPALVPLAGGDEALARAGRRLAAGKVDLDRAIDEATAQIAAQNPGRRIQGQALTIQDVRALEVPKEIMAAGGWGVAVHVELVVAKNSPWATLVVLIAYAAV